MLAGTDRALIAPTHHAHFEIIMPRFHDFAPPSRTKAWNLKIGTSRSEQKHGTSRSNLKIWNLKIWNLKITSRSLIRPHPEQKHGTSRSINKSMEPQDPIADWIAPTHRAHFEIIMPRFRDFAPPSRTKAWNLKISIDRSRRLRSHFEQKGRRPGGYCLLRPASRPAMLAGADERLLTSPIYR